MRLAGCATGVDDVNALGLASGDGEVGVAHAPKKCTVFLLKTVLVFVGTPVLVLAIASAGAFDCDVHVVVEKNGEVGLKISAQHLVQLQYGLRSQLTTAALIGLSGVGEAIAKDNASVGQRGQN